MFKNFILLNASAEGVFTQASSSIENLLGRVDILLIAVLAGFSIITAFGCIIGGEQSREKAKKALPWVLGASFVILTAWNIAEAIISSVAL